jgi:predicted DNA-binding transcriptional regulator YafY
MRADRLLSTLLLLQGHGRLTVRDIAKRLEVSMRTVHRDMEALGAAGVPVYALRGSRGGWQLDDDWRTRVPGLDSAELRALLMAQPRFLGDEKLSRAAESAMAKLLAALPAPLRKEAVSMRERLHVDTTGWSGAPENLAMLPVVQDAVARDRKLHIRYRKGREKVERIVDPLGLVAKSAAWYLVARTPAGLRTYRVSRIEEARLLDRRSERPAGFDLAAYWKASTEELRSRPRFEATLVVDEKTAGDLPSWRNVSVLGKSGDRVTLRVPFEDEEQSLFVILGFGSRAEVVGPESLRERVSSELSAAMKRYRS